MSDLIVIAREQMKEWRRVVGVILARLKLELPISDDDARIFFRESGKALQLIASGLSSDSSHYFHVRLSYFIEFLKNVPDEDGLAEILKVARDDDEMCCVINENAWSSIEEPERNNLFLMIQGEIWGPRDSQNKAFQALIIEARNAAKRIGCFQLPISSSSDHGARW